MPGKGRIDLLRVVEIECQGVGREIRGDTRRGGYAQGQCAGACLDQKRVRVPVVAAFEFDDGVAAGESARQSNRRHGRLGARVDHAYLLERRHQRADRVCHFCFDGGGGAKAEASGGSVLHGAHHLWMCMPGDHRAP